jgi:ectoine hydroxylase-related dioxygenase (phytanoyl-CoA dioxygenase family)
MASDLHRDGAVVIPGLLDERWCERLRVAIDRCRLAPGLHYGVLSPSGAPRVDSDLFRWSDDADLFELTHDSPLVDAAAELLGTADIVLVEDQWFASAVGASTPSPWHQDEPYYRFDRPFLTIWVTLDAVGDDGSLRVVPGSHASGALYAPVEFAADGTTIDGAGERLTPVPDVDEDPERFPVRSWTLEPGDAIALDSRTLHATGTATTVSEFRRVSTRWAHPDTRYVARSTSTASFWETIGHGLADGDLIAGDTFPLIARSR